MISSFLSFSYSMLCALLLFSSFHFVKASSSNNVRMAVPKAQRLPLHGLEPDKFVASAPLIVAAVCKDGVVVVATHTAPLKEPLLMEETCNNNDENENERKDSSESNKLPNDIPLSFKGPFRIHSVDGFGTTLTCAGWRTDGEQLAATFRSLASSQVDRFGEPSNALEYGRYLSQEASEWMAKCAVSDNTRALSCVGLLATAGRQEDDSCGLWLVDAVGAYRVKAHAVGLGAKTVNERLRKLDFSEMTMKQGALRLLETIVEDEPKQKAKSDEKEATPCKVPDNARVEVAFVAPLQRKANRIRIDSLLSEGDVNKV